MVMIKFEIKIEGDASDLQALKNLTAVLGGEVTEVTEVKTTKKRAAANNKNSLSDPSGNRQVIPVSISPEKPVEATKEVVTIEDVRVLVKEKAKAHKDAIKTKLGGLGATSVTTLDEKHYSEMAAFLTALA